VSAFATIEDVMGMFSKAFFKKVVFASFIAASLVFTGYPQVTNAIGSTNGAPGVNLNGGYQYQAPTQYQEPTGPDFGCSANPFTWFQGCVLSLFYNVIVIPISWGLGVAALLFNFSFEMSMDAGAANGSSASIFADGFIKIGWLAVRDLINITFIFALLQVAILLIVGKSGGYQDRLKNIIIAAIFINFSYFIVTEAIKLSNAFTRAIYNQIVTQGTGIADGFTTATGISAFGSTKAAITEWAASNPWSLFIYLIFSAILMVGFIGVLLMSTAMFISRYVVLVLCVVFSPVLFLGLIWPQFGKKTEELKQTLVGQLMFPIIYLLLIWVGLNFINIEKTAQSVLAINTSQAFLDFGNQAKEIVFRFLVASALFITALTAAKQYSQMGSKGVSKIQGALGKGIGTVAFGGTAAVGRTLVGGVGGRVLQGAGARLQSIGTGPNSNGFSKFVGAAGGRALGRGVSLAGDKTRTASFDVRSGTVFQAVGNQAGTAEMYGKAREGGFEKAQKDRAEDLKKRRDQLKATTAGETAALMKAQVDKQKKDAAAEAAFKAQHKESHENVKDRVDRIKKKQKEWSGNKSNTQSAIKTQTAQMVEAQKMKVKELETRKNDLLKAGPPTGAGATELADIAQKLSALEWKKSSKGKEQVGKFSGDAATLKNLKLDSFANQDEAIKTMQVEAEKAGRVAALLGQKAYAEEKKLHQLEKEKAKYDQELKAAEKAIKGAGKGRASTYDKSIASNLNPFNVGNSLVNSNARQQYFAKVREEAASGGKGGKKK